jgi:hypothetical protein
MVTTAILATNKGVTPCSACRYISCVPFPFFVEDKWWYCDDCDSVTANLYKAKANDTAYNMVELTCPNGALETIPINVTQFSFSRDAIVKELPTYCRDFCASTMK